MATKTLAESFQDGLKKLPQSGNVVEDLFDRAYAVEEVKTAVFDSRLGIRDALRNLDKSGILSKEQSAALAEMFPERKRGENGEGEGDAPAAEGQ